MTKELKEMVKAIGDFCDTMDEVKFNDQFGVDASSRTILTADLLRFTWFLAAADDTLTPEESAMVGEVIGSGPLTTSELMQLIKSIKCDIIPPNFLNEIPVVLRMFVAFDLNVEIEKPINASDALIFVFEQIGKELISSDGDIDTSEIRGLRAYINNMKSYVKDNVPNTRY